MGKAIVEEKCKQCAKVGKEASFWTSTDLEKHLQSVHGVTLNKEAKRLTGLYSQFLNKDVELHIRGRDQPLTCKVIEVSAYDILVESAGKTSLIPKHAVDMLSAG
ncbi:MAG TPA: hypothetical protein VFF30_05825 [Nitrososphaerales archaeon]|nr:hypothetical protein [Nitrososphaerales archaeon]